MMTNTFFVLVILLVLCTELAFSATSNYVIFGGTTAVVRTRIDPIVNPGAVSTNTIT